jgi:phosphoribosylformimino-5-aminoimidazole carboxamide ribotide isomerase
MQDFPFQIIPVIDLMHGQVVHAKHGQRNQYLPIESALCPSSEPLVVADSLMKLYPFQTVYIADIDAIQRTGNNNTHIQNIAKAHPYTMFWLDAGAPTPSLNLKNIKMVVGSESIDCLEKYLDFKSAHILSLDYNHQGALGLPELHETSNFWPEEVICMTLNAVGSNNGVDIARLEQISYLGKVKTNPTKVYAAGGIRNIEEIQKLADVGLSGALVATALHSERITKIDIIKFYAE